MEVIPNDLQPYFEPNPVPKNTESIKQDNPWEKKMNENLFTSFITPTIIGLPIVTLVILFPSIILPAPNQLISNQYVI
jgi:hypothetical protein